MFLSRNPELKITLTQAADEAREHDHPEIGSDHLLVAMLTNVRGRTYRVLTEHGLDYPSTVERLVAYHAQHPAAPGSESRIDRDREALRSIGIDLDAVREAVRKNFDTDLTDDWGERRAARGARRHGGRRPHGPHGHRGGRRGPRSRRGPRTPLSPTLRALVDDLRSDLHERFEASGRHGAHELLEHLPLLVLATLLRSDDPALAAVLGDIDREALQRDVESRIAVAA